MHDSSARPSSLDAIVRRLFADPSAGPGGGGCGQRAVGKKKRGRFLPARGGGDLGERAAAVAHHRASTRLLLPHQALLRDHLECTLTGQEHGACKIDGVEGLISASDIMTRAKQPKAARAIQP